MITALIIFGLLVFVLAVLLLVWQISNIISVFFGSPYVGAGKKIIKHALKMSRLKRKEMFYDLGCGKGDSLLLASNLGANAIGFEVSPYYLVASRLKTITNKNVSVQCKNIFKADLTKADVVYCYLMPELLKKLAPKFKRELKKTARLVSVSFRVPGLKETGKEKYLGKTIYLYSK